MSLTPTHGDVNSTKPCRGSDVTLSCRKVQKTIYGRTRKQSPTKRTLKYHTYLITERCYSRYSELDHNLPHVSSMYITPHTPNNNF